MSRMSAAFAPKRHARAATAPFDLMGSDGCAGSSGVVGGHGRRPKVPGDTISAAKRDEPSCRAWVARRLTISDGDLLARAVAGVHPLARRCLGLLVALKIVVKPRS